MNSSGKDYKKIYILQDKFLSWWKEQRLPFYLTGGTALGRFYLNHRFSEDLDFFINDSSEFKVYIAEIKEKITSHFSVSIEQSLFSDDFARIFINEEETFLKIEFVNDVKGRVGDSSFFPFGRIDTPLNILSNKITAITGRDEPKDIFDILHLSLNYSFHWVDIFNHAKQKAVLNELDVVQRLATFPIEWLGQVDWLINPIDVTSTAAKIQQIADDFLLGKANYFGKDKISIEQAKPFEK